MRVDSGPFKKNLYMQSVDTGLQYVECVATGLYHVECVATGGWYVGLRVTKGVRILRLEV